MTSRHTETRHHPQGKTCFHFTSHGLTCDQYDELRARANGRCEICGTPEKETMTRRLSVDHFHGWDGYGAFIRGMLCHYCNNVVMCCLDGKKPWSAKSRQWEAKAREYEANSWQAPPPEALPQLAARREMNPKGPVPPDQPPPYQPPPKPPRRYNRERTVITLPSQRGVPAMARALRRQLRPDQLAQLVQLLAEEAADAD